MSSSVTVSRDSYRERIYAEYRQQSSSREADLKSRAPYLRSVIRNCFPADRDSQVLDLGCGDGALLYFLQEAGYTRCRGVDISPTQAAAARQSGIRIEQGDLIQTLFSTTAESLDVVVTLDVIEHFTKSELLDFADEIYRVLKTGGRWVIHCPNGDSPFFAAVRYGDWTHEQAFTRESLSQLARASGFSSIICYEDRPITHGARSFVRAVLWKALRKFIQIAWIIETGSGGSGIFSRNILAVACKTK
jgi:SAM-dependent methyltransferase